MSFLPGASIVNYTNTASLSDRIPLYPVWRENAWRNAEPPSLQRGDHRRHVSHVTGHEMPWRCTRKWKKCQCKQCHGAGCGVVGLANRLAGIPSPELLELLFSKSPSRGAERTNSRVELSVAGLLPRRSLANSKAEGQVEGAMGRHMPMLLPTGCRSDDQVV